MNLLDSDSIPILKIDRVVEPAVLVKVFNQTSPFLSLMSTGRMSHCQLVDWSAVIIT